MVLKSLFVTIDVLLTRFFFCRKDFSVRFPDSIERTAANIIRFIFEHGAKARKAVEDLCLSETVREQIIELGISLHQVEEEKRLIEVKLREALRVKELWNHRRVVALKRLKQAEDDLTKERELRVATEHFNKNLERQHQEVQEKVLKLVAGSKIILNDLGTTKAKLKEKEKQLTRLSFESRRILAENEELFQMLKKKETALQGEKKAVLELQKSLIALRRRATYLEISNNILRTKLKNSNSKAWYSNQQEEIPHFIEKGAFFIESVDPAQQNLNIRNNKKMNEVQNTMDKLLHNKYTLL